MMDRMYLIFEILAILFCLHGLYGQKFKWNIYTILYIGLEVMVYQISNVYEQAQYLELVVYIMMFIYLWVQFKKNLRINIINYILCVLIIAVLQVICYLPMILLPESLYLYRITLVNILLLVIVVVLYKSKVLFRVSEYMTQKSRFVFMFLIILLSFVVFSVYSLRTYTHLRALDYFILIVSIVLLFIIALLLFKERMINQQMKVEKELSRLYGNALVELIDRVKINQHNYNNQLVAIQGMIFTAETLEGLQEEQKKYYASIRHEEQYSNLLSEYNDRIVAGFLYSKLCNVDANHININCSLHMQKEENSLFLSDMIQILGVLIDNAIEEVVKEQYHKKSICIEILEDEKICLEVRNICRKISINEISEFFKKGNSTKGQERGLGLYSVKEMVKKWNGDILSQNKEIEGENWFSISIFFPKNKRL